MVGHINHNSFDTGRIASYHNLPSAHSYVATHVKFIIQAYSFHLQILHVHNSVYNTVCGIPYFHYFHGQIFLWLLDLTKIKISRDNSPTDIFIDRSINAISFTHKTWLLLFSSSYLIQ